MSTLKYFGLTIALLVYVFMPQIQANAATPNTRTVFIQGKIDVIAKKEHGLIVDDKGYHLSPNTVIKSSSGKILKSNALYPGRRIRMEIIFNQDGNKNGLVKTIYVLP